MKPETDSVIDYDKENRSLNYDKNRRASNTTLKKLMKTVGPKKRKLKILSLGCGTGNYEIQLSKYFDITGIDISKKMIGRTRKKAKGMNIKLMNMDMRKLIFPKDCFDAVYTITSLHHVAGDYDMSERYRNKERLKVFREVHKVLKSKGKFIIIQSCNYQYIWYCRYFPEALKRKMIIQPKLRDIKKWFSRKGFGNVKVLHYYDFATRDIFNPSVVQKKSLRDGISAASYINKKSLEYGLRFIEKDKKSGRLDKLIKQSRDKLKRHGNYVMIVGEKK